MPSTNRIDLARDVSTAFAAGDRERIESLLGAKTPPGSPPDELELRFTARAS